MPSVVLYAGMPKTGSSSVQRWLEESGGQLRQESITAVVAERGDKVEFVPYGETARFGSRTSTQGVNSGWIVEELDARDGVTAEQFVAALGASAESHGRIVVAGEAFAGLFVSRAHGAVLSRLDELAASCEVRVAYYVRPQDTALEAAWRQWGFRSKLAPSGFVERAAGFLHHLATLRWVSAVAPRLSFELRPFSAGGVGTDSVVADFARHFLGLESRDREEWANRGLSLEVVNLLRLAPPGMFWRDVHDNAKLELIKAVMEGCDQAPDDRLKRSRDVLHRFAFDEFGVENAELGWPDFVPPPRGDAPGIEALDQLWTPQASEGEQAAFFRALEAAIR